ncbi:MAG: MoaD/ThiS family protein [Myxococcales bacterium]|nr:MoaD/ThiS family protein [Myxococcales bacterium]
MTPHLVILPTHLRSYTAGVGEIEAVGQNLNEVLDSIEHQHLGFRIRVVDEQDRIRPHIKCFVNGEQARSLDVPITGDVQFIAALSGG